MLRDFQRFVLSEVKNTKSKRFDITDDLSSEIKCRVYRKDRNRLLEDETYLLVQYDILEFELVKPKLSELQKKNPPDDIINVIHDMNSYVLGKLQSDEINL
ncbi:MAG TPA: hypothetical protein VIL78_15610 [Hanamia sp.]